MNPIIWRQGVCDPHVHVFEDKVYLYATHDSSFGAGGFRMLDWQIWSSVDLVNWKLERTILPEEFYCGKLDQCWAVDAAYRDGKYYWYFSTGAWGVGVGVSDHPAGPFEDALGSPLVDFRDEPAGIPKWDPCVFQDDDGSAYIIVGDCRCEPCCAYMMGKLSDDMIHLAEPLRKVEYRGNICPEDKASIHKYNGRYYLTHSSSVAVSDNVYGPYDYIGNTGCNVDHGSYFTFRGQTYFASGGMDNPNQFYRASFIAPCHYRDNGEIVVDQKVMEYGSGQYDASWKKIDASWYFAAPRDCKKEEPDGSFAVSLREGDYLEFPNISSMEENAVICFQAMAEAESPVTICVREGNKNGKIIGKCEIPGREEKDESGTEADSDPVGKSDDDSREKYMEVRCALNNQEGKLNLCITVEQKKECSGDSNVTGAEGKNLEETETGKDRQGILRLSSFSFESETDRSVAQPALCEAGRGAVLEPCAEASWYNVLKNLNLRDTFIEAVMDGGSGGDGTLEIWYHGADGDTELWLSVNGVEQGAVTFADTEKKIEKLSLPVTLKPGLNRIRLACRAFQTTYLGIDRLVLIRKKEKAVTYPAANGQVFPRGNGCWDGLPQRECDPQAFTGRTVKYLGVPGQGCIVDGIDGGEAGADETGRRKVTLIFHYALAGEKNSSYRLRVNGKEQEADLVFPGTGSGNLADGGEITAEAELMPGEVNVIELEKTGEVDGGIMFDAVTVIPEEK